jgi:succinyl-CoA synthetase alpha subunit
MSILIDARTRFILQGAAGDDPLSSDRQPFYASSIVAHVPAPASGVPEGDPARALIEANRWLFDGVAVYASVGAAAAATGAEASIVRCPSDSTGDAVAAAIAAGLSLVVVVSDFASREEREHIRALAAGSPTRVLGPHCPGLVTPGACQVGAMPGYIYTRGRIGILSKRTLAADAAALQTSAAGLGQSTMVALGRQPLDPQSMADCLELFLDDSETDGVVLLGEAEGRGEEEAAARLRERGCTKPVIACIADQEPERGSEAGRVARLSDAQAARKAEALREAGAVILERPAELGLAMRRLLELRAGPRQGRRLEDFAAVMRDVERVCYDAV